MKYLGLIVPLILFMPLGLMAENRSGLGTQLNETENLLSSKFLVADNSESDEDLFMDEAEEEEMLMDEGSDEPMADTEDNEPAEQAYADEEEMAEPSPPPAPTPKATPVAKPEPIKKPTPAPKAAKIKKAATKPMPKPMANKKRKPASFKQGFKKLAMDCDMHGQPNQTSDVLLSSKSGKKLWLEGHGDAWYKGYHKGGHGFFPAECFE